MNQTHDVQAHNAPANNSTKDREDTYSLAELSSHGTKLRVPAFSHQNYGRTPGPDRGWYDPGLHRGMPGGKRNQ
jgi:hypothetical protein